MNFFRHLWAFMLGVAEFRRDFTKHYSNWYLARRYDQGREWAHRITLRRYE